MSVRSRIDGLDKIYNPESQKWEIDEEQCAKEIDRLASFILKELSHELGKGDSVNGESAVDVAIRLLSKT